MPRTLRGAIGGVVGRLREVRAATRTDPARLHFPLFEPRGPGRSRRAVVDGDPGHGAENPGGAAGVPSAA